MGTLDDLFIKAKDLASAAGNKAQELAELTKIRLQAAQMRSDLDANYLKLGEIVYELQKAGTQNQDLIDMCIAEIEEQNRELDEINAKVNELKNEVKCPECMAANNKEAIYCSRCGVLLRTAEQAAQAETSAEPIESVEAEIVQESETTQE